MFHENVENILLNCLYVTLPFYFIFIFNKSDYSWLFSNSEAAEIVALKRRASRYLTFLGMVMIVLMMKFPLQVIPDHSFDLRQIPIIMVFLYLGRKSGLLLFISMVLTRFFIGGSGFYGAVLTNVVIMIFLFLFANTYRNGRVRTKVFIAVGITLISGLVILFDMLVFYRVSFWSTASMVGSLTSIQAFGLFITIYSIEKFRSDQIIRERLRKAEKSQVVSELAASVSHEIRNPLTVTKGFLQLALRQELPLETKDYLQMAQQELTRAEDIIGDYLTFAKPALDNPQVLEVKEEVEKVCRLLMPYASMHGVAIETHLIQGVNILGEQKKFHQCLSNLIKNAIEASITNNSVRLSMAEWDQRVEIYIQDKGVGMTSEDLRRIGEPYYSTKEKGTGLGMMVAKSIIESMKGYLTIESERGKGSTFALSFPKVQKTVKEAPQETIIS